MRTGKTLLMLREASKFATENPEASVLVIGHSADFCRYMRKLSSAEGLSDRVKFVPASRAGDSARGRRGEFFVDHYAWERASSDLSRDWGALLSMRNK